MQLDVALLNIVAHLKLLLLQPFYFCCLYCCCWHQLLLPRHLLAVHCRRVFVCRSVAFPSPASKAVQLQRLWLLLPLQQLQGCC
jgi:hypothetical protein